MWYGKDIPEDDSPLCFTPDDIGGQKLESVICPTDQEKKSMIENYLNDPPCYKAVTHDSCEAERLARLRRTGKREVVVEDPVKVLIDLGLDPKRMAKLAGVEPPDLPKEPQKEAPVTVLDRIITGIGRLKNIGISPDIAAKIVYDLAVREMDGR